MRILAQPFLKGNNNPYTYRLYAAIEKLGHSADHISLHNVLLKKYDIWHRHWPEITLSDRNAVRGIFKTFFFVLLMDWARLKGTKHVWTVHNLENHEKRHPAVERLFWKWYIPRLDGYISLSESGYRKAQEKYPDLKKIPGFIVPHPHYRMEYPNTIQRGEARARLGLASHHKVFVTLGNLRPYKNIPRLIELFRQLPDPDYRLFVAGSSMFPEVTQSIAAAVQGDERISLYLDYVPAEEVQLYLNAADVMVLPYTEILNSGSAMLALSFNCPVLVIRKGAMAELQATVGEDWVYTYEGELTTATLEAGLQWALHTDRTGPAPLHGMEDEAIAQKTVDAYEKICFSQLH